MEGWGRRGEGRKKRRGELERKMHSEDCQSQQQADKD